MILVCGGVPRLKIVTIKLDSGGGIIGKTLVANNFALQCLR